MKSNRWTCHTYVVLCRYTHAFRFSMTTVFIDYSPAGVLKAYSRRCLAYLESVFVNVTR